MVAEEIKLENGKKLVKFDQTPKMCTYLLYFGVGEFEYTESKSDTITYRVYATPGNAKFGELGLKTSRESIEILEELTGIPFPINKMDNIAVKDFQFGAMENYEPAEDDLMQSISEVMEEPTSVRENSGLVRAFSFIDKHQLLDLPVINKDGQLVGLASRVDMGRELLNTWWQCQAGDKTISQ
jgi:hypothetical protein